MFDEGNFSKRETILFHCVGQTDGDSVYKLGKAGVVLNFNADALDMDIPK